MVIDQTISPLSVTRLTGSGGSRTWNPSGGWNNTGYVAFTLPSTPDAYACFGQLSFSPTVTTLNIGFLISFDAGFIAANEGAGVNPKTLIIYSNVATGERPMLLSHSYDTNGWEYGIWNNVTTDWSAPPKGGFNLANYLGQWMYFETEIRRTGQLHRFYLTTQDHAFNQTLIHSTASNYTDTAFSLLDVLGSYGGMVGQYRIGRIWFSTSYIGPPPGF